MSGKKEELKGGHGKGGRGGAAVNRFPGISKDTKQRPADKKSTSNEKKGK